MPTYLSKREKEIANLLLKGLTNRQMSGELGITEKTVKFHLTSIYKKSNVKNRTMFIVTKLNNNGGSNVK